MEHFCTILETRLRRNWEKPALSDYRGATFTSAQVAEQFARLHLLFKSFGLEKGDKIALVGRNGEGKTTFARILIGEHEPTEGSIRIGANVSKDTRNIEEWVIEK